MLTRKPLDDAAMAKLFQKSRVRYAHEMIDDGFATTPHGFWRNHLREIVGSGEIDFEFARQVLCDWEHFPRSWAEPTVDGPTAADQQVAVTTSVMGLCVTNVCRVCDITEHHSADWATFATTYTTVAGHDMLGAETFRLTWDKTTDVVSYEVTSYSQPQSWLGRMALPYIRSLQRRFAEESCSCVATLVEKQHTPLKAKSHASRGY